MLREPLTILDFETTGLRPNDGDRITEVGLVRIEEGRITDRFQSLVNCDVRVPSFITAYTGITQQMVDAAPPVGEVMQQVARFIGNTPVAAHSASFDERFFVNECRRLDMAIASAPFLCSLRLARRIYPNFDSHALGVLTHALKLPSCGKAHRAAVDAENTAHLMLRMGEDLEQAHAGLAVTTQVLRRLMRTPVARVHRDLERLCA